MDEAPLPEAWCTTPEAWALERRLLFRNVWQVVARACDMAEPGTCFAGAIAGTSVAAVRQADGTVLGFRNICRHQGMPVLEAGLGRCDRLRCRFHGWTYGLDGRLVEAPPRVAPRIDDPEATRLVRIAAADYAGFVVLNLDAQSPTTFLLSELEQLAAAGDETLPATSSQEDANWKHAMEGLLSSPAAVSLVWPNMVVISAGAAALIVVQPKGFQRCEVLRLPLRQKIVPRPHTDNPSLAFRRRVHALHGERSAA